MNIREKDINIAALQMKTGQINIKEEINSLPNGKWSINSRQEQDNDNDMNNPTK